MQRDERRFRALAGFAFLWVLFVFVLSRPANATYPYQLTDQSKVVLEDLVPLFEINKIIPPAASFSTQFGTSVAIDGDFAVVGAPGWRDANDTRQGAVYIFQKIGNDWVFRQRLNVTDASFNSSFGTTVAIDDGTLAVGAPAADGPIGSDQGAVYVYINSAGTFVLEQRISAADAVGGASLGNSVAIDGDTIVGGAPGDGVGVNRRGSVYFFGRTNGVWTQQAKFREPDSLASTQFGTSVAISGDTAAAGGPFGRVSTNFSLGIVEVYERTGGIWNQVARLSDAAGISGDEFGRSVDVNGSTIVVGVPRARATNGQPTGIGCVFVRDNGGNWVLQQRVESLDTELGQLGSSVSISGNTLIMGAPRSPVFFSNGGVAYVFRRQSNLWSFRARLVSSDIAFGDFFGAAVFVADRRIMIGAPLADPLGVSTMGAAYYFVDPPTPPDLQATSDTGNSSTDNVTSERNLSFDVPNVTPGATIELRRAGNTVSSVVAIETTATLTENAVPVDTALIYTSREVIGGETSSESESLSVLVDQSPPTVFIGLSPGQSDPTNANILGYDVIFNEPVFGFDSSDISLAGSTADVSAATVTVQGSGSIYLVTIQNVVSNGQTVRIGFSAGAALDAVGLPNTSPSIIDDTIVLDNVAPTIIINQAAGQADPVATLPLNFTVTFSEPVVGFDRNALSFQDSTAVLFGSVVTITGSGLVYNVAVGGDFSSNGQFVRLKMTNLAVRDLVGNQNLPSTSTDNTITLDNVAPTVTINQAFSQSDPTRAVPINFRVMFSEVVTGFDPADVSLAGSTVDTSGAVVVVTGSGQNYNVSVGGPLTGNSAFLFAAVVAGAANDPVGNPNVRSTGLDNRVTLDNVAPSVTINQSAGQPDPTSVQPILFSVMFSESVTGFTSADVSLADSTAGIGSAVVNVSGVSPGSLYTVSVRNVSSNGQLRVRVLPGAVSDPIGNGSTASTTTDNVVVVNFTKPVADFDGDGKTDISIFRPSAGEWWYSRSRDGNVPALQFGTASDNPIPSDFTGDGLADIAFWRPTNGFWFVLRSEDNTFFAFPFGAAGDIPLTGDFDADGKNDPGVYRPSTGTWFISQSTEGVIIKQFGISGDKPVNADYDGDGRSDVAIFRPSDGSWWFQRSSDAGVAVFSFGVGTDRPVPGDFTGDLRADIAVYRPTTGEWFVQRSDDGSFFSFPFGANGDEPAPGDYDGDGRIDAAVFRPVSSTWFINRSNAGILIAGFGSTGDRPIPGLFVP